MIYERICCFIHCVSTSILFILFYSNLIKVDWQVKLYTFRLYNMIFKRYTVYLICIFILKCSQVNINYLT